MDDQEQPSRLTDATGLSEELERARDRLLEADRMLLGELVNALDWCQTRYRQTLASQPVLDVDEMRAYVDKTLSAGRARLGPMNERLGRVSNE